ncbi:MAG: GWxTD domain-containing protein [Tunicatimonas sp.]
MKTFWGVLAALVLTTGFVQGQNKKKASLSSTNVGYVYDPTAPVQLDARVAMNGQREATVFLRVTDRQSDQAPSLRYAVHSDYQTGSVLDSGQISASQMVKREGEQFYYRFTLPVSDDSHFLFVFVSTPAQVGERYRFDITLNSEQNFPLTDLLLMRPDEDIPIFQDYLPTEAPFRLVSYYGSDSTAYLYYYSHDFEPNPPPMSSGGAEVQPALTIDSLFAAPLDETLRFEQPGLYFVQLDTTSLYGISFRIEDQYYPRLARVETIVPTLRYISTSDEMKKLENSEEPKRNLDDYWIKMARSQERAKGIIRDYFRQVTQANQLFTSYKEGWKTGQGMVYTLYGPPDAVYRDVDKETWIYNADRNLVDLSFTFAKVKNIFTHQYYNLVRDDNYKRFWYRNVDLWRKGGKEI